MGRAKKRALFTNLYLAARTGSELHVLELAKRFKQEGWDVTCYALTVAYPLQGEFEESDIRLVSFGHEDMLDEHYDLLWAQHHIVIDFLWETTEISFEKVVISILGAACRDEILPKMTNHADLIVFVSDEARDNFSQKTEALNLPVSVFPNYTTEDYFELPPRQEESFPTTPEKIAVISNHPPP